MAKAATLLLLVSCAGPGAPIETGDPASTSMAAGSCPEDSVLDWENWAGPFFRSWCTGCHSPHLAGADRSGAPVGVDFVEHQQVVELAERIRAVAADSEVMPPAGGPEPADRARLGEWLACGAP